jgi:hypothetical protein
MYNLSFVKELIYKVTLMYIWPCATWNGVGGSFFVTLGTQKVHLYSVILYMVTKCVI